MRIRYIPLSIQYGHHRRDMAQLTWESAGSGTEQWSLDVPSVLWILERVAAGDVEASRVAEELRSATEPASGCCVDCDQVVAVFPGARRRFEQEVLARWH